tara:strand:- start:4459 stop:4887 length:429 start_codon:yes stop_codon:yes gene_type:complete
MATPSRKNVSVLRPEVQLGFDFDALPLPDESKVLPFTARKPLKPIPKKAKRGRPAEKTGNDFTWSVEQVVKMREVLLEDALEALASTYTTDPDDYLEWMKSDEIGPFTFRVCCSAAGYDPDELRDAMLSHVDDAPWFHSSRP